MPDRDFIADFAKTLTLRRAAGTVTCYARAARVFTEFMLVSNRAYSDPFLIRAFSDSLISEQYKPASIANYVNGARIYLDFLREQGVSVVDQKKAIIPHNAFRIRPQLKQNGLVVYRAAVEKLGEPWRTALLLEPCLGLRASELVSVRLKDIKPGTVFHMHVIGKGNKERDVPMTRAGNSILIAYLRGARAKINSDWLFPSPERASSHISTPQLRAYCQQVRGPLGLHFITPHALRRTYLTAMARGGLDPWTLADIAGHSDIKTLKHYIEADADAAALRAAELRDFGVDDTTRERGKELCDYFRNQR